MGKKLGIKEGDYEAWYKVRSSQFLELGGSVLHRIHNSSMPTLLRSVFPEHDWDITKFPIRPRNHWRSNENVRAEMDRIGLKLGIKQGEYDAWYNVRTADIVKHGGRTILVQHKNSVSNLLMDVYTEHHWDLSKFTKKPQHYWKDEEHQRSFMIELAAKLGIKEGDMDAWYKVTYDEIVDNGGSFILTSHNSSVSALLKMVFPEHPWEEARFHSKPKNFWQSKENQRKALEEARKKLGLKEGDLNEWYRVSYTDLAKIGMARLVVEHNSSVSMMLMNLFPDHPWDITKFESKNRAFWHYPQNQRALLESIRKKLQIPDGDYESWYKVTFRELLQHGASAVLRYHSNSPAQLLQSVYSEHPWDPYKFHVKSRFHRTPPKLEVL